MTSKIIKEYTEPLTTPINADRSIFTILEDRAERTVALDLHRDARAAVLEGVAHHGAGGQRTTERRGGDRRGVMDLTGTLRHRAGTDGCGVDLPVL